MRQVCVFRSSNYVVSRFTVVIQFIQDQMRTLINPHFHRPSLDIIFMCLFQFLIFGLPGIYPYTGHLFNYKFFVYPRMVKFLYPLANIAQMITVYLTLTVTMERYVAVCHPLRARSMCTYGRARIAVLCIIVASVAYNFPK